MKRSMTSNYNRGDYEAALECVLSMETQITIAMGRNNAVYASCLNNLALMHKCLGNHTDAMDAYTEALHKYEDLAGKKNTSYAATLANMGVLFKTMAEKSKGMDKLQLLERSEEALKDALALRVELSGPESKEAMNSQIQVASILNMRAKTEEAEKLLNETLKTARKKFGPSDTLCATVLNNLGLMKKNQKDYASAREFYEEALKIRTTALGDQHPETVVSMHNLAELHLAAGNTKEMAELQNKVGA